MKKNVFVALLLAVVMVLSCMTVFVSADGEATTQKIAYVSAYNAPKIDGETNDAAWNSAVAVTGLNVTVLWGDTGIYVKGELADVAAVVLKETAESSATIATTGAKVSTNGKEAFIPYVVYTEEYSGWVWYNFKQEATNRGDKDVDYEEVEVKAMSYDKESDSFKEVKSTVKVVLASSKKTMNWTAFSGNTQCTQASDLIWKTLTINGIEVELAGPYGYTTTLGGVTNSNQATLEFGSATFDKAESWKTPNYDPDQVTGQSEIKYLCAIDEKNDTTEKGEGNMYVVSQVIKGGADIKDCYYVQDNDAKTHRYASTFGSNGYPVGRYGYAPLQISYASYVSAETAPVVDGLIDNVWNTTARLYDVNEIDDPEGDAYGYISILWSADGIYYLGVMKDIDVVYSGTGNDDKVNIFVTETYGGNKGGTLTGSDGKTIEVPKAFPDELSGVSAYGEYWFAIDAVGRVSNGATYLLGVDYKFAGTFDDEGYIVEAFVPYLTLNSKTAKIGHIMGVESSTDDYSDPNGVKGRDEYTNLGGLSSYWSNPQSQFQVVFVGAYDFEEDSYSAADLERLVSSAVAPMQQTKDALTEDMVDAQIGDYVDDTIDELSTGVEENATAIDANKTAIETANASIASNKSAAEAADATLQSNLDAVEAKIAPKALVIISFALVIVEAAAIAFIFVKKK